MNGKAYIDRAEHHANEELKLFQVDTGKLVIYNPTFGRYLRIAGPDAKEPALLAVKCDTEDPKKATVWTTPVAL